MWGPEENFPAAAPRPRMPLWDAVLGFFSRVKIRRKAHALRLAETLPLGDRRMLAVVEWRGETLLLGVTSQQITRLDTKNVLKADAAMPAEDQSR